MKQELVKHWMTRDVITITPNTSLAEAHSLMTEKRIRRLPVIDHGRLVGIVTLGDVRSAEPSAASTLSVWEMNNLLAKLKVSEIMTREPVTISQEATISTVAEIMLEKKIQRAASSRRGRQISWNHHRVGHLPARRAGMGKNVVDQLTANVPPRYK